MSSVQSPPIGTVTVVGTGLMGPSIAAAFADAQIEVTLVGRSQSKAKKARVDAEGYRQQPSAVRIEASALETQAFADAELVVETIVEDLAVKKRLFAKLEDWISPSTPVATNTSSLSIDEMAEVFHRPDRFAGLHFLNPAHLTGVVEIVQGAQTSAPTIDILVSIVDSLGKRPIHVQRDVPGFVWNRIQAAILRESLHLIATGITDSASIDTAVSDGLAPRWLATGPLATVDLGGAATWSRVAENLFPELSNATRLSRPFDQRPPHFRWSDSNREAIQALRAKTLRLGSEIAQERRELTPEAHHHGPTS